MRSINATEFKAKCLALLDEVAETGEHLLILKHGKPVAEVVPPVSRDERPPQESLAGSVEILGDIISPAVPPEHWEALRGPETDDG